MSPIVAVMLAIGLCLAPTKSFVGDEAPRPRFEFTSFGATQALARATRIVEAEPESVFDLPIGTSVVRFKVTEHLFPFEEKAPPRSVTVLAARGTFHAGIHYVLFLSAYRSGGRFTALARLADADRDYESKKGVVRQYLDVDRIADDAEREHRIIDLLISNLIAPDAFVRQNALKELTALHELLPDALGPQERARIVAIAQVERTDSFRSALNRLLEACGVVLERTKHG